MRFDKARVIRLVIRMGIAFAVWRMLLASGVFTFLSEFIPFSVLVWGVPSLVAVWFFFSFSWHRGWFFSRAESAVTVLGSSALALLVQYLVKNPFSKGLLSVESLHELHTLALMGAVDVAVLSACMYVSWQLAGKHMPVRR